jgi:3-hydroxyisobutyrate dehydrogenase-like beta-hydroxyacid dehydrogenase
MLKDLTVGWIGLGKVGRPMSQRIYNAGARVFVNSRNQAAVDEMVGYGLQSVTSPREAAENADLVLTLFDAASIQAVLAGEEGIVAGLRRGGLVIDMGTTDVLATREFARTVAVVGGSYLDAPVSGGTRGAADGSLTIMVGGAPADVLHAMPILSVLGNRVTHVGPVGAGQVAKAANQVIVGLTIVAVAEAFALASRAGVDLLKTREAMQGGFADSRILREHGLRMIQENYAPGATIAVQRKDISQALSLAKSLGLELPMTALAVECFNTAADRGFDQLDQSAVFKLLESADS